MCTKRFIIAAVTAATALVWALTAPSSSLAIGSPPGGFVIPAGATATFSNVGFSACNALDWGYDLDNGNAIVGGSFGGGCFAQGSAGVTIGPFANATIVRVFLDDNSCGMRYYSDGAPVDHVEVTGSGPYLLNFADSGFGCVRKGVITNTFSGYNLTVTLTIGAGDTTPPTIACGSPDGAWHGSDVAISCTASDSGSGLANPADANFSLTTSVTAGTETANASTDSRNVCDNAGNCATAGPIGGIMVDEKGPSISCGSTPAFLLNQAVATVTGTVSDAGSGVLSSYTSANADTSSVGSGTATLQAIDNVGNTTTVSCPYTVGYSLSGLVQPIANSPTVNTGKAGRTYPIKWQLRDANGSYVSALNAVAQVAVQATSCGSFATGPSSAIVANATGGTSLRYDSGANQYIYNWATPSTPGCYTLFVELDSGQALDAFFQLS